MNDKIKEALEQLKEGIKNVYESENFKAYLKTVSLFYSYSASNCLLIAMQKPEATQVAGFNAWKKVNRYVKKGEHGIRIICPIIKTIKKEKDGKTEEIKINNYKAGYVYDISQTGGEPLPEYIIKPLAGEVMNYEKIVKSIEKFVPAKIEFGKIKEDGVNGYFDPKNKEIKIKNSLEQKQKIKTLIHETAHCLLHEKGKKETRNRAEVEAESVAFAVSNYFGLDTSEYSFPYVASYGKENAQEILTDTLNDIQEVTKEIITGIETNYRKEK